MLKETQVQKGVTALLSLIDKKTKATSIVDQPEKIDLQFTFKKVPKLKYKTIPLLLPTTLHYDSREVCLFVKDLDETDREYEKTVHHYEDLFREKGVKNISKIVPMKALFTDYSQPHTRRSLAKAYELYLADAAIIGMLPGRLGKIFYAKKKTVPVQVNMKAKDLKTELHNAVHNSRCTLQGTGSNSMAMVAHNSMSQDEIVKNIIAAADTISAAIPGGKENIKNFLLKASDTMAIPLFVSLGNPNDVALPEVKPVLPAEFLDDVTPVEDGQVLVRADGRIRVIKCKATNAVDESDDKKPKLEIKAENDDTNISRQKKTKGGKANKRSKGWKRKSESGENDEPVVKAQVIEIPEDEDKEDEVTSKNGTEHARNSKRRKLDIKEESDDKNTNELKKAECGKARKSRNVSKDKSENDDVVKSEVTEILEDGKDKGNKLMRKKVKDELESMGVPKGRKVEKAKFEAKKAMRKVKRPKVKVH